MLLRFVVSNFLSIREELEFTMFPYSKLRGHTEHIYKTPKVDLLKVAAIYGANGSGKSNLVKAVHYLHDMVVDKSSQSKKKPIHFRPSEECANKPSKFEIEFKTNGNYYSYGLELLNSEIKEEWLYSINPKEDTEKLIFLRKKEGKRDIKLDVTEKYRQTEKDKILIQFYTEGELDHTTPFIYRVKDKDQYPEIQEAYEWFLEKLYIIHPKSRFISLVRTLVKNRKFKRFTNEIISKLDTGVHGVGIKKVPLEIYFGEDDKETQEDIRKQLGDKEDITFHSSEDEFMVSKEADDKIMISKVVTEHGGVNNSIWEFDLDEESDGTRRLFDLLPAIEMLANEEVVCIVDEIGRSLHPALLKEFLSFYLNQKTKGQFIFTTHESNLLDLKLFRPDEIWFMEKDNTGSTKTYSLSEFKPRYDLDIRKGYLNGRFGAIPFLGNLEDLHWEDVEEEQRV